VKISKNQNLLRRNEESFVAVKSASSDCNQCAFYCCELEDESEITYCNPTNRNDGQYIVWRVRPMEKTGRPDTIEIDLVYDTIKKMVVASMAQVCAYLDINLSRVKKSFEQLQMDGKIEKYKNGYRIK